MIPHYLCPLSGYTAPTFLPELQIVMSVCADMAGLYRLHPSSFILEIAARRQKHIIDTTWSHAISRRVGRVASQEGSPFGLSSRCEEVFGTLPTSWTAIDEAGSRDQLVGYYSSSVNAQHLLLFPHKGFFNGSHSVLLLQLLFGNCRFSLGWQQDRIPNRTPPIVVEVSLRFWCPNKDPSQDNPLKTE